RPPSQCALVKCSFRTSACAWTYDRWKLLNGKIVNEGQGDAVLSSEPVLLPMNAHFELDILARYRSRSCLGGKNRDADLATYIFI
ncbi:unnamed protein product, partial [Cylicostephanus goldi]